MTILRLKFNRCSLISNYNVLKNKLTNELHNLGCMKPVRNIKPIEREISFELYNHNLCMLVKGIHFIYAFMLLFDILKNRVNGINLCFSALERL